MKYRYVLFIYTSYGSSGGWGDFYAGNDDLLILLNVATHCMTQNIQGDIWSIIDLTTFKEVAGGKVFKYEAEHQHDNMKPLY